MSDQLSSVQETVVNGDVVTTTTEIKTVGNQFSIHQNHSPKNLGQP